MFDAFKLEDNTERIFAMWVILLNAKERTPSFLAEETQRLNVTVRLGIKHLVAILRCSSKEASSC